MTEEPTRWLDDPSIATTLRADLVHGVAATATGVDYAATLTSLRAAIAAQTGPLAPAAMATGTKLGAKVAALVIVAGGAIGWWAATREPATGEGTAATKVSAVVDVAAPAPAVPEAEITAQPLARPSVAPTPQVAPTVPAAAAAAADADDDDARPERKVVRNAGKGQADYLREAKLIAQARKSLAGDPENTLALTRTLAREFPKGLLVEERRALGIRALAALGRTDEARQQAASFLATYGDGPHAAAVRRATEP